MLLRLIVLLSYGAEISHSADGSADTHTDTKTYAHINETAASSGIFCSSLENVELSLLLICIISYAHIVSYILGFDSSFKTPFFYFF